MSGCELEKSRNFKSIEGKIIGNSSHEIWQRFTQEGSIIIIDNTNVKAWETKFYVSLANEFGYVVFMVTPRGQYTTSAHELARRNKHGVSVDVIKEKLEVSLLRSKYQLVYLEL